MQNLILKQTETIRLLDESTIFNKQNDQFVFDGSYSVAYIVSNFSIYSFHLDDKQVNFKIFLRQNKTFELKVIIIYTDNSSC